MSELTDTELEAIRKRCEDGALVPDDIRQLLAEIDRLRAGLKRFLNPEDMGFAVSPWVRDTVREMLGQPRVEHERYES